VIDYDPSILWNNTLYTLTATQHVFPTKMISIFLYYRCKAPNDNDYYTPPGEISFNTSHGVQSYNVTECHIQINGTMSKCNSWVYDKSLFTETIISKVIQWFIDWCLTPHLAIYQLYHGVDNTMTNKQHKCHAVRAVQKCHAVREVQKCHAVRAVQKWTRNW
jgi:hypothetical protein